MSCPIQVQPTTAKRATAPKATRPAPMDDERRLPEVTGNRAASPEISALSSATERGLHAQVVWKPAAAWAVEVWEVSDVETSSGSPIGTVTVVLSSVPPEEDREV